MANEDNISTREAAEEIKPGRELGQPPDGRGRHQRSPGCHCVRLQEQRGRGWLHQQGKWRVPEANRERNRQRAH